MKVNSDKTAQIVISDAQTFQARAHIYTTTGQRIDSGPSLKLLGFYFSSKPNCGAHVEAMRRSFRGKFWLLIHLKQNNYTEAELVRAYTTLVRPVAEYVAPVFHSMLTEQQDEQIERLQSTALRYIYGYGVSYRKMRELSGLSTLRQRRVELCDKFASKRKGSTTGSPPITPPVGRGTHCLTERTMLDVKD